MADQITQTLGFDAAQALETLKLLDDGFATFDSRIKTTANDLGFFNKGAGKTVAALKQIHSNAKLAADQLARLKRIPVPTTPTSGGGGAVGQQLLTGQAAANAMNQLLGQTTTQANSAAGAVNNLGNAAQNSLGRGRRAAAGFAISFETLVRVITTQAIVRAFSAIRNAVGDAFGDNLDFVRSLAEIQTIARDSSIEELGAQVRGFSDAFNIPLLDTAHAKYEILSNGFADAADNQNILTASSKFAKTAVASTADSVDVITGTLNAFGKSADEAELVAAKLFRTVDQGKVVGAELARGLGRINPVVKELGASLDEGLAAISTITIAGVPSAEALTQIRAAMTALLKPSDAAKEAFQKLGVENGVQLVRAKGLIGAFKALIDTTDGQANSVAKLFPNVRALNAVFRLTGSGAQKYGEILQSIQNTDVGQFNEIFTQRISTDAEKLEADMNRLKNFFTVDLGRDMVKLFSTLSGRGEGVVASFARLIGGVDGLIQAMKSLVGPVTLIIGSFAAYGAVLATLSLRTKLAQATLTGLGPALTGLGNALLGTQRAAAVSTATVGTLGKVFTGLPAGITASQIALSGLQAAFSAFFLFLAAQSAGDFIGNRFSQTLRDVRDNFNDHIAQLEQVRRDADQKAFQQQENHNSQLVRSFNDLVNDKRAAYFRDVENAKEANQRILNDSKATFDRIISARESLARDFDRAAKQAAQSQLDSQRRLIDAEATLDDKRFESRNKRFRDSARIANLSNRAEQLASAARSSLAAANTPEQQDAALDQFRRALQFAEQATSIDSKRLADKLRGERAVERVLQDQIAAEKQLQAAQEKQRIALEKQAAKEKERVDQLKTLAAEFLKNADFFDKKGNPLAPDQIEKQQQAASQNLSDFFKKATEGGKALDIGDLFAFDQLASRLRGAVTDAEITQLSAAPTSLKTLASQIQRGLDQVNFVIKLTPDGESLRGKSALDAFQGASQSFADRAAENSELRKRLDEARSKQREIENNRLALDADLAAAGSDTNVAFARGGGIFFGTEKEIDQFINRINLLKEDIKEAGQNANLTAGQLAVLVTRAQNIQKSSPTGAGFFGASALEEIGLGLERLNTILDLQKQAREQVGDAGSIEALDAKVQATQQRLDSFRAGTTDAQAKIDLLLGKQTSVNTAVQGGVEPSKQIADNWSRTAAATERAAINAERLSAARAAGGSDAEGFARGGVVKARYLASGGFARGTDTIPAVLSEGETVINAASSRKFFSQLQSIQAGVEPVYRQTGGPAGDTFNISGDIVVQGSGNPRQTARELMNAARREKRRNTGRF